MSFINEEKPTDLLLLLITLFELVGVVMEHVFACGDFLGFCRNAGTNDVTVPDFFM